MSHMPLQAEDAGLRLSVNTLVASHGKWRVIFAALRATVRGAGRGRPEKVRPQDLPASLRRDLGLPPVVDPPSPTVMMVYFRP